MLPLVLDFYVRALLLVFYQLYSTIPGVLLCTGRQGDIVSFDLHNAVCTVVSIPSSIARYSEILDFGSLGVRLKQEKLCQQESLKVYKIH